MEAGKNWISDRDALNASHQDPASWKWGLFYYNRQDPRLMPPKRNPGLGVTINFANWRSVLVLVFMMAATAGLLEGLAFLLGRDR